MQLTGYKLKEEAIAFLKLLNSHFLLEQVRIFGDPPKEILDALAEALPNVDTVIFEDSGCACIPEVWAKQVKRLHINRNNELQSLTLPEAVYLNIQGKKVVSIVAPKAETVQFKTSKINTMKLTVPKDCEVTNKGKSGVELELLDPPERVVKRSVTRFRDGATIGVLSSSPPFDLSRCCIGSDNWD